MKKFIKVLLVIACPFSALAQTNWSPEQCLQLKNISYAAASPDGSKVVYTVREALMTDDRSEYINQIWLCNANGTNAVQITKNDKNNTSPTWSPDGRRIAFVSNRDGKNNLYVLSLEGGEAEKITDTKSGVGSFSWSPDGNALAFLMTDAASDDDEKSKKAKNDWFFVDETFKQNRLYLVSLVERDSSKKFVPKKLTQENYNVNDLSWSPDGKFIAFSHGRSAKANDGFYSDLALVETATGKVTALTSTPRAGEASPVFSPDSKRIVFTSTTDPADWSGPEFVKIYSLADGKITTLKATPNQEGSLLGWTADGKNVFYEEANRTLSSLYLLGSDGNSVTEISKGEKDFISLARLNAKSTTLTFLKQNPSKLAEVYISPVTAWAPTRVTHVQADHEKKTLPKTELIKWKGADGLEIEGLLTYPIGYNAGQKVPLILNVHGGPAGVFTQACVAGNSGAYPLATLAESGYAILRANPRGSSGYGAEFRMGNRADWGGKDYVDLMNGVDHVIAMGVADETRLGVMGWSYGGFMSSWIVGHTDRFKVASIGAPVVDLVHQNLTDDIAGFVPSYFKADPWMDWAAYDAHSPLRFVQNVKTPVLLQHCEGDQRVPISNGYMFYNALKRREVPVRMLVLPRQAHGPVEPRMNLKVFQSNLEWINQHIAPPKKS